MTVKGAVQILADSTQYRNLRNFWGLMRTDRGRNSFVATSNGGVREHFSFLFTAVHVLVLGKKKQFLTDIASEMPAQLVVLEQAFEHQLAQQLPLYITLLITEAGLRPSERTA